MNNQNDSRLQTIVIGGGQAGLAVGYHLAKNGISFQILDASQRIGDAWRTRWDSLRLFTPARYAGLPGMPFPLPGDVSPTKQQMADYLENYAAHFHLPVRSGVKVDHLSKQGDRFVLTAGSQSFEASSVIIAMSDYQKPKRPEFAAELSPEITQLHSHEYRNPSQLQAGGVLIVGVGNSGADIALEVAKSHPTWLSGKESGQIAFDVDGAFGRYVGARLFRFVAHHVLTVSTPIGRKVRPKILSRTAPLVRVKADDLTGARVKRVAKVVGVREGQPVLADESRLEVKNVIWCTGYSPSFSWIDLPIFGENGKPVHQRGVVSSVPGMYFVGLHFLYAMSSATIMGVGRDAARIARVVALKTTESRVTGESRLHPMQAA